MANYKQTLIDGIATLLCCYGYTVYLSKNGEYGFFTDGTRCVSFQYDLGGVSWSGNYSTDAPGQTGTGWKMEFVGSLSREVADRMVAAAAPMWAVKGAKVVRYTTPEQHLAMYGESSGYALYEC